MEKWTLTNSTEGSSIEWKNRIFPEDEPDRGKINYNVKDPNFLLYSRISVVLDSHHDLVRVSDETTKEKGRVVVLVDKEHNYVVREEEFLRQQEAGWDH